MAENKHRMKEIFSEDSKVNGNKLKQILGKMAKLDFA